MGSRATDAKVDPGPPINGTEQSTRARGLWAGGGRASRSTFFDFDQLLHAHPPSLTLVNVATQTMPVRLRLARHGTRNAPFYHVVAIPDHKPRDARPIEKLGEYDPIPRVRKFTPPQMSPHANMAVTSSGLPTKEQLEKKEKRLEWNTERIRYWLSVGAQPSKPVAKMLDRVGSQPGEARGQRRYCDTDLPLRTSAHSQAGLIPEGKWFKGMYRPPAEASHFNPQLETADGAASASSSSNAASSAKPPPPAPAEKPSAA